MKILTVLQSRKFWAAVIALGIVFGVLPQSAEAETLNAMLTVATAAAYIIGVAIEDSRK